MTNEQELKTYFHFEKNVDFEIELVLLPDSLLKTDKPHLFKPHRTNFYHIFLFEDCQPTHWIDFEALKIKPYSLLFLGKGQVHHFDDLKKYKGYELIFTEEFYNITDYDIEFLRNSTLFNSFLNRHILQLDKQSFGEFFKHVEAIQNEINQPNKFNKQQILKNLVHNLLLFTERKQDEDQPLNIKFLSQDITLVLKFRSLLEQQFRENKSVINYARQLFVTEKRLGVATRNVLGKLPKDMIEERVILESKRFLIRSQYTIKEICFDLGFNEPTYFTKFFKKHEKKTPLAFRSEILQKKD
ncbi:MAG: helix-turn-helix domain-containing protein [Bacteroidales bacterium]|nr:helix-turn-helix domain-containing protein [Bacteroidales bacterium]